MITRLLCSLLILASLAAYSAVKAPNYDFNLDTLQVFLADSNLAKMEEQNGKFEVLQESASTRLLRFYISHQNYRFPVFVQIDSQGKPLDFHAQLPSYFLHDVFHQSLINRYKKQDQFIHHNGTSLYRWNNVKGMKLTYSATCTITCFPIYLAGELTQLPENHQSILKRMEQAR